MRNIDATDRPRASLRKRDVSRPMRTLLPTNTLPVSNGVANSKPLPAVSPLCQLNTLRAFLYAARVGPQEGYVPVRNDWAAWGRDGDRRMADLEEQPTAVARAMRRARGECMVAAVIAN